MTICVAAINGRSIAAFYAENGAAAMVRVATAFSATTSWCWQLMDYRCGTEWPIFRFAQRFLRRKQDGVHRAPRRFATAISKGKTTPGSPEEDDRALAAARQFGAFTSRSGTYPRRRSLCAQQPAIPEESLVLSDPMAPGIIKSGGRTDIGYHTCPLGADIAAAARSLFPAHRHSVVAAHQRGAAERHDNMDSGP